MEREPYLAYIQSSARKLMRNVPPKSCSQCKQLAHEASMTGFCKEIIFSVGSHHSGKWSDEWIIRVNKACYLLTSSEYRSWNWCVEANLIKTKHITAFAKSALNSHRYGDWLEARTRYINWLPVIDDHPKTSLLALLPPWARLLISQTITIQSNPACRLEWLSVDHLREIAEECIRDEDFAPA